MAEATLIAPPDEANGVIPDEANPDTGAKGTADENATVRQEDTGDNATDAGEHPVSGEEPDEEPELKHSDATLTAARETAAEEARKTTAQEHVDAVKALNTRYSTALKETAADRPAAIRGVVDVINSLSLYDGDGNRVTAADLEPVLAKVGGLYDALFNGAIGVIGNDYRTAFSDLLGADAEAFWKEQAQVDPSLHAKGVAKAVAERIALTSDAVKGAKPEDLIAANKALKEHVSSNGDDRYNAGRKQGRKDPVGERGSANSATPPADPSYTQLQKMTDAQLNALPPGVQARVIAKAVSEG